MSVEYFEDWLGRAFCDLCFATYIDYHLMNPFSEYKNFFCLQSLEKILKAYLISKQKIKTEQEAKKYSHNLPELINEVIFCSNVPNLREFVVKISIDYFDTLFNHKAEFLLAQTIINKSFQKKFENWCDSTLITKVPWVFYLLCQAYFETRYPFEIPLPKDYDGSLLYDRDGEYLNSGLVIVTIKFFKLFLSLFDRNDYEHILQHTYNFQEPHYDDMPKETKDILLRNQNLYLYLINANDDYFLNMHK